MATKKSEYECQLHIDNLLTGCWSHDDSQRTAQEYRDCAFDHFVKAGEINVVRKDVRING